MDIERLGLTRAIALTLRAQGIDTTSKLFEAALTGELKYLANLGYVRREEIYLALLKVMVDGDKSVKDIVEPPPPPPPSSVLVKGLTLRDFFASQVVQGLMKDQVEVRRSDWYREDISQMAFSMADSLIDARFGK